MSARILALGLMLVLLAGCAGLSRKQQGKLAANNAEGWLRIYDDPSFSEEVRGMALRFVRYNRAALRAMGFTWREDRFGGK